jgi:Tripartite tricarboxylate transporter family receptor
LRLGCARKGSRPRWPPKDQLGSGAAVQALAAQCRVLPQKLPFVAHLEGKVTVAVSTPRLSCRTAAKREYSRQLGARAAAAVERANRDPWRTTSSERLSQFPDLPTVAETIPGFSATGWQVLVAPVGTPEPIIRKVSDDLRKVVTDAEFKTRLGNIGSYSRAMSPAEVLAFVQKEQQTWLPVLEKIAGK